MAKRFYTITEAAKKLGVTRAAIHGAINARPPRLIAKWGTVKQVVATRALLIPADSLNRLKIDKAQQKRGKKKS